MNGLVHFFPIEAKSLYTKILNLALNVNTTLNNPEFRTFVEIVYENEIFNELIESSETEVVYNEYRQNINMFWTKFREILFDFHRELVWSFECNFYLNYNNFMDNCSRLLIYRIRIYFRKKYFILYYFLGNRGVYVKDPDKSAERICDMLFFRALLEFLYKMIEKYGPILKTKDDEKAAVKELIEHFDISIKYPERLFKLNLNKNFEEEARDMIIQKVEKFLNDYIKEKIDVSVYEEKDEETGEEN